MKKKKSFFGGEPTKKGSVLNALGGAVMVVLIALWGIPELGLGISIAAMAVFAFYAFYQVMIFIGLSRQEKDK